MHLSLYTENNEAGMLTHVAVIHLNLEYVYLTQPMHQQQTKIPLYHL